MVGTATHVPSRCATHPIAGRKGGAQQLAAPVLPRTRFQQLFRPQPIDRRGRRLHIIAASSSLDIDAQQLADKVEDALPLPNVCNDDGASKWDRNEKNLRKLLQKTYCTLRKNVWVVALGLFYLYNEAVAKLPWVRWHRFEKWFWTKVRSRWLPAASAATVLARQYAGDLSKDMRGAPGRLLSDAWNAPGRLLQRREAIEAEVKEEMEHAKEDLDENLERQRAAVKKTLPDAVNPLLVGQNLRERLDEGLIDRQSFKSAMAELKQKVPFLPGSNGVRSELESQSQDMKDPPAKPEPAAGFLNLPVAGSLGGPSSADGKQALAEAAEDVQEQEADRQGFNLGFLKHAPFGLGGGGSLNGKQGAEEAAEKQDSGANTANGISVNAILKHAPFGFGKEAAERAEAKEAEEDAAEAKGLSMGMLKGLFKANNEDNEEAEEPKQHAESTEEQAESVGFSLDVLKQHWPFNGSDTAAAEQEAEEKSTQQSKEKPGWGFLKLGQ